MSRFVLSTGHEIPVDSEPEVSQADLVALLERGEEWAFSGVTGAWFQLRAVVAILPDGPKPKPRKRAAANGARS